MRPEPSEGFSHLYETAMTAQQIGMNVIPVRADGSKSPALNNWRMYQQRRVTPGEIHQWFRSPKCGLAVVTGTISGNLEALDIDSQETYQIWLTRLQQNELLRPIYERIALGYLEATPDGGRHLLYRCEG
jgi:Bifunctional DNA primase/polymerase, N-terminal